jgi:hypothetical protein
LQQLRVQAHADSSQFVGSSFGDSLSVSSLSAEQESYLDRLASILEKHSESLQKHSQSIKNALGKHAKAMSALQSTHSLEEDEMDDEEEPVEGPDKKRKTGGRGRGKGRGK